MRVSRDDLVRGWLAYYGAPLYGTSLVRGMNPPTVEEVVADALALARKDSSVARALPVMVFQQRTRLNLEALALRARRTHHERELGFFLELTGKLGGDAQLEGAARKLRNAHHMRRALVDFFPARGALERMAAEQNTPDVARDWGYRMNMGMDSFRSMFAKATRAPLHAS